MAELLKFPSRSTRIPTWLITGAPGAETNEVIQNYLQTQEPKRIHYIDGSFWSVDETDCSDCAFRDWIEETLENASSQEPDGICIRLPLDASVSTAISVFAGDSSNRRISATCALTAIVTVVDALGFDSLVQLYDKPHRFISTTQSLESSSKYCEHIIEFIEFADIAILIHTDKVRARDRARVEEVLHELRPGIRIVDSPIRSEQAKLNDTYFHPETTPAAARWLQALRDTETHFEQPKPENASKGYMVYRRRVPFHPERLWSFLNNYPLRILRSIGTLWIAGPHDTAYSLSQFGMQFIFLRPEGAWVDALPPDEKDYWLEENEEMGRHWDNEFGDRYSEIVFIGDQFQDRISHEKLCKELDACLLSEIEMRQDWSHFRNPFSAPQLDPTPILGE